MAPDIIKRPLSARTSHFSTHTLFLTSPVAIFISCYYSTWILSFKKYDFSHKRVIYKRARQAHLQKAAFGIITHEGGFTAIFYAVIF